LSRSETFFARARSSTVVDTIPVTKIPKKSRYISVAQNNVLGRRHCRFLSVMKPQRDEFDRSCCASIRE